MLYIVIAKENSMKLNSIKLKLMTNLEKKIVFRLSVFIAFDHHSKQKILFYHSIYTQIA